MLVHDVGVVSHHWCVICSWQHRRNSGRTIPCSSSDYTFTMPTNMGLVFTHTHQPAGFVTSGLELWKGEPCAQSYFRQRLWGTLSMAQTLLSDRMCWMRHMKLDPVTGMTTARHSMAQHDIA
jgi:hypothetical protein